MFVIYFDGKKVGSAKTFGKAKSIVNEMIMDLEEGVDDARWVSDHCMVLFEGTRIGHYVIKRKIK